MEYEELLDLWFQALDHPIGIAIETTDRLHLQRHLYAARKRAGNPMLEAIAVVMPPRQDEVWLCKRTPHL
jgi:hypothetical protein